MVAMRAPRPTVANTAIKWENIGKEDTQITAIESGDLIEEMAGGRSETRQTQKKKKKKNKKKNMKEDSFIVRKPKETKLSRTGGQNARARAQIEKSSDNKF